MMRISTYMQLNLYKIICVTHFLSKPANKLKNNTIFTLEHRLVYKIKMTIYYYINECCFYILFNTIK